MGCQTERENYPVNSYTETLFQHSTSSDMLRQQYDFKSSSHELPPVKVTKVAKQVFPPPAPGYLTIPHPKQSFPINSSIILLPPAPQSENSSVHQALWTARDGKPQLLLPHAYRPTPHTVTP